ncbi:MAG: hypothetical protein ACREQ5_39650, partial [Candidatus Dormibacteria bacterium]
MWGANLATLATNYASPSGPAFKTWATTVEGVAASPGPPPVPAVLGLPGAKANPPTITFDATVTNLVTVTVNWQGPNDLSPHHYVSVTQISR